MAHRPLLPITSIPFSRHDDFNVQNQIGKTRQNLCPKWISVQNKYKQSFILFRNRIMLLVFSLLRQMGVEFRLFSHGLDDGLVYVIIIKLTDLDIEKLSPQ